MRPFDEVLPADALRPRDLLPTATDELLERLPLLVTLPDPAARVFVAAERPVALPDEMLRPLVTAKRRALAERPLAVLLEVLLEAERAREVPERFLEAPRVFERERERDRDRDRDRALLAEVFLTERRLPADDLALLLAERLRLRLGVQTQTHPGTHHMLN